MATLQSNGTSVKVVKGDTLWGIAEEFASKISGSGTNAKVDTLVSLNNIKNRDLIYVGQVLKLSGTASSDDPNNSSKATITAFGLQAGPDVDRTVFAIWTWDKANTENYETMWYYDAGNRDTSGNTIWFVGSDTTTEQKQSIYNAPANAKRVRFQVKPVSKKKTVNNTQTSYWTANWSTFEVYDFSDNPPMTPSVPTVTIEKNSYKLTAKLENIATDINATDIQFQIVKDDSSVFHTGTAKIVTNAASYSCVVDAGGQYKVRCRSFKDDVYSGWTNYSSNVSTIPAAPSEITVIRAQSETSVYLEWTAVATAETYELEYATERRYLEGSNQTTTAGGIEKNSYELGGLTSGDEYFFRVRAVNQQGNSAWSGIKSVVIGKKPAAPTTWSSTTTAVVEDGETVILYWVHNAEDGSSQTRAQLEIKLDGAENPLTYTIRNLTAEEEKDKTRSCTIDISTGRISWVEDDGTKEFYLGKDIVDGTKMVWKVRTAGVTNEYGDWSVDRTIDIYAPATLSLRVLDINDNDLDVDVNSNPLVQFPFYVKGVPGPDNQAPISYHLSVLSDEIYETTDRLGNTKIVNAGEAIYSKHFDIDYDLMVEMSASNIDLENNVTYTVQVTVSMNSGLTATQSNKFVVAWTDNICEPNAEISVDLNTYTASIRPYCEDVTGNPLDDILLSVYRREFDGSFVEIASGLVNGENTYVTDPHPSLDLARYRIVATTQTTGAVSYCDLAGYPVGGKAVIIQWNEDWSSFESTEDAELEQPPWSGSMLKLQGNIDVSEDNNPDVALVEYIGREHPVSYYGTHIGQAANWSMEIEKSDKETLYALRRLQRWLGDVYVREPSGSGYWANIKVSFSQKHCEVTIPVTMSVTRVEGGV